MKRQIFSIMLVMSLAVMLAGFISANGNPGSIWTTNGDCGDESQDVNHYGLGETVYINGNNFNAGIYAWDITGQPGQASCDPNIVVASGNITIDSSGAFCFEAYTIQIGDCGEYKASVGNKHDNYRVDEIPMVPEFGIFIGAITVLSAVAVFFVIRRK